MLDHNYIDSCPYYPGAEYQLRFQPPQSQQAEAIIIELSVEVLEVFEPITTSPVLKVALRTTPFQPTLPDIMVLKLYDRRYAKGLRELYSAQDWTPEWESEFRAYMSSEDRRSVTSDDWDDLDGPKEVEAYLEMCLASYYESEVRVYERMMSMQGKEIPLFLGTTSARFQFLDTDTEVPGILLEFVQGTSLDQLPAGAVSSEVCQGCMDIVQGFGDCNILNQDVRLANFIVPTAGNGDRLVVMIDFAQTRMRGEDESDEEWREAKRSTDEEGAIGFPLRKKFGWEYRRTLRYHVRSE